MVRLPDAGDFYHSPFFKDSDPHSGLGGWGNPAADMEVQDGGFATGFKLAYPFPHNLRRNFTLRPWINYQDARFPIDELKAANETFTASVVETLVNGYTGDFEGFQIEVDRDQVSPLSHAFMYSDNNPCREYIGQFTKYWEGVCLLLPGKSDFLSVVQ